MGKYISSSESVIGISNIRNLLSVPNLLRRLYPDQDLVTSAPDLGVSEGNQGPVGPGDLGGTEIVLILVGRNSSYPTQDHIQRALGTEEGGSFPDQKGQIL